VCERECIYKREVSQVLCSAECLLVFNGTLGTDRLGLYRAMDV